MIKIFIAPQSGEQTTSKYSKTPNGGYKISDLEQILHIDDYQKLKLSSEVYFWGNKPNSKSKWDKIEIGDFILFYSKRKIVAYSKILLKTHNSKLAEEVWGWTKTENGGEVLWEYLYFFDKPVTTEIPFKDLIEFADYDENYVIQGFTIYSIKGTEKLTIKFGSIENYLNSFEKSFVKSLLQLDFSASGLTFKNHLINRFTSSLLTKPFVILTGLSGSGKTKLAQAFATWVSESKNQYAIVPVGADWTNREPLLGYPNSLNINHYVMPDSGVLDILLSAFKNYSDNGEDISQCKPYFLILDEMNLSHVERYFADFLSTMESGDYIKLYADGKRSWKTDANGNYDSQYHVEHKIKLPPNLFIIGTVNIDETTYMFSPKVLDRANTIEFRISETDMGAFILNEEQLDMSQLLDDPDSGRGKGATLSNGFMKMVSGHGIIFDKGKHKEFFTECFKILHLASAEFGYRVVNEITKLIGYLEYFGVQQNNAYDICVMQKFLPKINGSRSKLSKVLPKLGKLCLSDNKSEEDAIKIFDQFKDGIKFDFEKNNEIKFPISFEKLCRMYKNAQENGFASFAEA